MLPPNSDLDPGPTAPDPGPTAPDPGPTTPNNECVKPPFIRRPPHSPLPLVPHKAIHDTYTVAHSWHHHGIMASLRHRNANLDSPLITFFVAVGSTVVPYGNNVQYVQCVRGRPVPGAHWVPAFSGRTTACSDGNAKATLVCRSAGKRRQHKHARLQTQVRNPWREGILCRRSRTIHPPQESRPAYPERVHPAPAASALPAAHHAAGAFHGRRRRVW